MPISANPVDLTSLQYEASVKMLHARTGILVGDHKKPATARALATLAKKRDLPGPDGLLNALANDANHPAWEDFINCFTINHTAFFREPHHFKTLAQFLTENPGPLSIWCAAAATGEEAYSIAIVANEVRPGTFKAVDILATDIDTSAISVARRGVYDASRIDGVEAERIRQNFLRGASASSAGKVKVNPDVASLVRFDALNLNDRVWPQMGKYDAVFCRNTMIYFDRPTQIKLLARFAEVMRPGALLFVGHSENISPLTEDFRLLGQTVYERK